MPLALTPEEVAEWTGVTVPAVAITVAAQQIDALTGYTVDEHDTARSIEAESIRMAWALVAVRVDRSNRTEAAFSVTSEAQGDYTYSESVTLAEKDRYRSYIDGRPSELLRLENRAVWGHV